MRHDRRGSIRRSLWSPLVCRSIRLATRCVLCPLLWTHPSADRGNSDSHCGHSRLCSGSDCPAATDQACGRSWLACYLSAMLRRSDGTSSRSRPFPSDQVQARRLVPLPWERLASPHPCLNEFRYHGCSGNTRPVSQYRFWKGHAVPVEHPLRPHPTHCDSPRLRPDVVPMASLQQRRVCGTPSSDH